MINNVNDNEGNYTVGLTKEWVEDAYRVFDKMGKTYRSYDIRTALTCSVPELHFFAKLALSYVNRK